MNNHQYLRFLIRNVGSFHAQEKVPNSSSRIDQVPDFRQEICQSHYRNDPVKYDLECLSDEIKASK